MIRSRLAALAAVALAVAVLGLPGVASATNDTNNPDWTTPTRCVTFGPEAVCEYLRWHRQADDSGVTVDGMNAWVSQHCDYFESNEFSPVSWSGFYSDGSFKNSGTWADGDCSFSRSVNFNGGDNGSAIFQTYMHARLDTAADKNVWFQWRVYPNGDSTLLYAQATDCPCTSG